MDIFSKILQKYNHNEYVIQLKARFVLFGYLIVISVILISLSSTLYTSLRYSGKVNSINFSLIISYLAAIIITLIGFFILIKGYYTFAAHLLLTCSFTFVWVNSLVAKTVVDSLMDTMIYIIALLSMLPLVITKKPRIIILYAFSNAIILYLIIIYFGQEFGLSKESVATYLTDNSIAIFAVTLVAWQIFTINKRALDKAEHDFGARIKAEVQLKDSELFKERVFDNSRIPIVIMDPVKHQFVEFNNAAIHAYGYPSRKALLGKTLLDVSAHKQYDGSLSSEKASFYINKALSEGAEVFEWLHKRHNGEIWDAEVHLLSFKSNGQTFLQFSLLDITKKKAVEKELADHRMQLEKLVQIRTEALNASNNELISTNTELSAQREALVETLEDLKATQDQLIQSEKMASLGILAAGIAHEINNPLNYIYNGTSAIESYINDSDNSDIENLKPLFNAVNTGVERVTAIVKSMSSYSRSGNHPYANCNIQEIIDDCLIILHNQYKNRIEIEKNYVQKKPFAICNEGQIHQAFLNILANAIQAIENKGKIVISVSHRNSDVTVSIADTGGGISDNNLKHIFDPFFTTKNPGEGTGLGLSITKKIIDEHKGIISCESIEKKGTTFKISLPLKS